MIDLQTFVRETLVQICNGVTEAADVVADRGAVINPEGVVRPQNRASMKKGYTRTVQHVAFDVALTTTEEQGAEGGIGVMIGSIGIGSKGKPESEASSLSRVSFTVPIALPASDNDTGRNS